MPDSINNKNLDYQPKTKNYSFTNPKASAKTSKRIYLIFITVVILIIFLIAGIIYTNNNSTLPKPQSTKNNLDKATFNPTLKQYVTSGLYLGSDKNNLKVTTANGEEKFLIDSSTSLGVFTPQTEGSSGGTLSLGKTYTFASFIKEVPKQSFVQIFYTTKNNINNVIKIYYFPEYRFK